MQVFHLKITYGSDVWGSSKTAGICSSRNSTCKEVTTERMLSLGKSPQLRARTNKHVQVDQEVESE